MKLYGSEATREVRQNGFTGGDVTVSVFGLGKMGLPLAAVYADVTGSVVGVDVDPDVVESVQRGVSPVTREPGLPEMIESTVERGALTATTDGERAAAEASVHVVIVPTLVDEEQRPDLGVVRSVVSDVATGLEAGDTVVVESTVPPRTCRDVIEPQLASESGLDESEFGVAFCPERTSSGRALEDIWGAYPKVVGGTDDEATEVATLVYETITDAEVLSVSDATTAEAVKVFEGVYRDTNIALANELATFADDLDISVLEAIDVANTLPFCQLHTPGAGVGGHCIPYYPHFLIGEFDVPSPLMQTAREVNDSMPGFTTEKLIEGLTQVETRLADATVVVLGLTYRAGVPEIRHAPSIPIVERLVAQGADVYAVDPVLEDFSSFEGATPIEIDDAYDRDPDAVVLVTDHEAFDEIEWDRFRDRTVVVDGRQALSLSDSPHLVYTIGEGGWSGA